MASSPYAKLARILGTLLLCSMPFMVKSSTTPNLLEQIMADGVLTVLSSNGPTTFYEGPFGFAGFEYELAEAFADEIGVELAMVEANNLGTPLEIIRDPNHYAHFASDNFTITAKRLEELDFSAPYLEVTQEVIYKSGEKRPRTIADLIGRDIAVIANSSHSENLAELKISYPELEWREIEGAEQPDMLELIHEAKAEIVIVDSNAYTVNRLLYPRARAAFPISYQEDLAWAFKKQGDDSLVRAASRFIRQQRNNGNLEKLQQKYFNRDTIDASSALTFTNHIRKRLPKWEKYFRDSAEKFEMDWLLLASISYQESLWNHRAKSYTGVRGLMMLTQITAKQMGIKNRVDPQQSIYGGAKYFTQTLKRIPERISTPDRIWFALAAYNVGYGHLNDARIITQQQGGNADLWDDVKKRLPLLAKKKYYKKTKHGFARGWEPVTYVENIRNYYDILVLQENVEQKRIAQQEKLKQESQLAQQKNNKTRRGQGGRIVNEDLSTQKETVTKESLLDKIVVDSQTQINGETIAEVKEEALPEQTKNSVTEDLNIN